MAHPKVQACLEANDFKVSAVSNGDFVLSFENKWIAIEGPVRILEKFSAENPEMTKPYLQNATKIRKLEATQDRL